MSTTEEAIRVTSLQRGAVIEGSKGAPVSSLDFHRMGEYLVAASEDGAVHLINALEGKARKKVYCKKYGVEIVRFTHHEQSVLCTSKPSPSLIASANEKAYDIRYLSLYDNQYLRFFSGHEGRVSALTMSYTDDRFLSASVDGTVRLWTLQQPKCLGYGTITTSQFSNSSGQTQMPALVEFDPSGMIFAAGAQVKDRHLLKLYDPRNFSQGAFETFSITKEELLRALIEKQPTIDRDEARRLVEAPWIDMEFSMDGKYLLVATRTGMTMVFDAYDLKILRFLTGYKNRGGLDMNACFTPDGTHILTGSEEGEVCVFDAREEERTMDGVIHRLKGHLGPVRQVKCNPRYEVVASSCSNVVLWIAPPGGGGGGGVGR